MTTDGIRRASMVRSTRETSISIDLSLDNLGQAQIETGLGFLDHMLTALVCHSRISLQVKAEGDLHVDDHHTIEDCALTIGAALDAALGDRTGIARFGFAFAPLDESLARTVIDLSGRGCGVVNLLLTRERIGDTSSENLSHFFISLASAMRSAIHVDVLRGENDHHKIEAAFKSFALALRQAIELTGTAVPSTKGSL